MHIVLEVNHTLFVCLGHWCYR